MNRIVIANFYPVYPFEHGGQRRVFFLARELARRYAVTLVTLGRGAPLKYLELDRGLTEIQVPVEPRYLERERELLREFPMTTDVAYAIHWKQCRLYQNILREQLRASQLAVSEHPYSFYAIRGASGRHRSIPTIYNSQNVELTQKAPLLAGREDLMQTVRAVERAALMESAAVIACSESDRAKFVSEYSVPASKITIIQNGVDCSAVPTVPAEKRQAFRRELGLGNRFTAIFGGSLHFPNLSAVDSILAAAASLPDVVFIILGSICRYAPLHEAAPSNVIALGTVPEAEKWIAFAVSDLALNPMSQGSGSNIKMFEYAAAGLPALSTAFGARGTGMTPNVHYYETEIQTFASRIADIARLGSEQRAEVGAAARSFVAETSDWRVIGEQYLALVATMLAGAPARSPYAARTD